MIELVQALQQDVETEWSRMALVLGWVARLCWSMMGLELVQLDFLLIEASEQSC
jgi:hypothetical protein